VTSIPGIFQSGWLVVQVSVCLITYNHEKFIEQAIKSVLEQNANFEYEIVVGEDCSTDTTASILRKLERQNQKRIRAIYRPANLGSKANFLDTLSMCNGEYVAFLEGDDYWTSNNKLQRQVEFLNSNRGAAGVFHRTGVINRELIGLPPVLPPVDPPEFFSLDFLLPSNPFSVSSLLARRACLSNIELWYGKVRPGDWALFMMLAAEGDLGFIPLEMSHYRVHSAGNWNRLSQHHRMALAVQMLVHVMGLVSGKDQELVESVKSSYANWWSSELVANTLVSIEAVTNEMNEIADFQLSNYLLAQIVAVARAKGQAQQWHESQAKALEAAVTRANQELRDLQARAAGQAEKIELIQNQMGAVMADAAQYRNRAAALSEDLRAIRESRSWKITAPLRSIATVIRGWQQS
jgi:glycosyltransferase involved in cell wall biosynthesis